MSAGCYDIKVASESLTPAAWPEVPFAELLRLAFRDKVITDFDHIVLKKLRGES
jgi:hypothetical protein